MSRSTRRSITSIKYPGWILLQTEATPLGKSLISLNAQRWSRMDISTRRLKSLSGRLRVMIRKTKSSLIEIFSLKGASSRCRSWMSRRIDYLSEEKYNLMKEKYNNMPKKKKKKGKKKKAKAKKKKKR